MLKAKKSVPPKWRKAPEALVQRFNNVIKGFPEVEPRKMFGYPCAFIKGYMFAGIHQESMFLRLSSEDREALLAIEGAAPFQPMPNRIMKEYVTIPQSIIESETDLNRWIKKSIHYTNTLPPKKPKPKKKARKA